MKKILAILLAVILVATLSLSAVMLVSAAGPQIVVSSTEAEPGETVDVTIALQNNPGLAAMKLKVAYDEDLILEDPVNYDILTAGGQATQPQRDKDTGAHKNPVTLNWLSPFADVVGDYTFATLTFTVADTATAGDKNITVTYDQENVYNLAEDDVVFGITNGKITVAASTPVDPPSTDPAIVVSSTEAEPGETVDVTIALQNNPGLAAMKLKVAYDEDLILEDPVNYDILTAGGQATQPQRDKDTGAHKNPVTLNWLSPFADVVGDYTFATLTFTVADTATAGDKNITVTYDQENVYNLAEDDVVFGITNGKITVTAPACAHANTTDYEAVASTCKTPGHAAYTKCNDCNQIISGSDTALPLDPNNHTGEGTEVRNATPATCTAGGYTGDTYCLGCGTKIAEGSATDPSDHTLGDWLKDAENHWKECAECQGKFDTAAHIYGEPVVTAPTTEAQGYSTYTCTVCGYSYVGDYTDPIQESGAKIVVSSTEAEAGETVDVTIALQNNPGLAAMKLKVAYDEDLILEDPVNYDILTAGGQATQPQRDKDTGAHKNPVTLNWLSPFADVVGDYTFATLTFTVANTATSGDKNITVTYDQENVYNLAEKDVVFGIENGKVTVTAAAACTHANTTDYEAVASTCKTPGHAAYTKCNDCNQIISGSDAALPLDPNNHEGDTEVRNAVPATCTTGGYTGDTYCLGCGAKIAEGTATDPIDHNLGDWLKDAENHWKVCAECEGVFNSAPHTFSDTVVAPTCTEGGYTSHTCTVCGYSYNDTLTDPSGHNWGEWTQTTAPTCTEAGVETRVCKNDATHTETRNVNALGHKPAAAVRENEVAATCEAAGSYDEVVYCSVCKAELSRENKTIDALGHNWGDWAVTTASTCKTAGVETRVCKNDATHTQTRDVALDPNNHTGEGTEVRNAVAAGCTTGGYTGDTYCLGCNTKIANGTVIDPLGHNYADTVTAPTCTEKGYTTHTCSRCQDSYVDSYVDAKGHAAADPVKENYVAPTFDAEGSYDEVVYCSVCKAELSRKHITIDKLVNYDVEQIEGKTEEDTAVYDASDASALAFKAKFAKSKLIQVKIGDNVLTEGEDYTVSEDGDETIVKLTDSYLAKLGNGNYTMTIVADDGVATSVFTVQNSQVENDNSDGNDVDDEHKSSKTGDTDIAVMVFALIAMMGASVFAGVVYRKKNESK